MAKSDRSFYFIGIAGAAMGAAAVALKNAGYDVSGADENVYPPMSDMLTAHEIPYFTGFDPAHLNDTNAIIVIGNALSRGNPEVETVLDRRLQFVSLPELIRTWMIRDKYSIVVTGTHGKSTTTSLLSWIFHEAGKNPGYMVGGIPNDLTQSCAIGSNELFIIEGDEYDTAFFDKRSKFLHYRPDYLILNNIELDHVDIFDSIHDIKRSFMHLLSIVPSSGLIIANTDDSNVGSIICEHPVTAREIVPVCTYGKKSRSDFHISGFRYDENGLSFELAHRKYGSETIMTGLYGDFQSYNVTAAIIASLEYGITMESIKKSVRTFTGLKRRLEVKGVARGITVIDDFAHHPTAVKGTLQAVKRKFKGKHIWAVLEPRSNSMRRSVFEPLLLDALKDADSVIVSAVYRPEKIPENERFNPQDIVEKLNESGGQALFIGDVDVIVDYLSENAARNDVILGMSNGGFGGLYTKLLDTLSADE
ncbi:UDP-N-acetylmuramate:L-alanyl-gamma-D-glutamyl-meso-diaminopimelate ligase [candidate division KSB1 bacterium]